MISELWRLGRPGLELEQGAGRTFHVAEKLDETRNFAESGAMRGLGKHPCDPHDLIHDAYRIEGIGAEECRAIFFDWAMGLDAGIDMVAAARTLLADLGGGDRPHPMSVLLAEAASGIKLLRRRTGRRRGRAN